jgi:predicted DNA-binding transcriptional regulator AlpA
MRVRSIRNCTAGEAAEDRQSTATPTNVKPSRVLTEKEAAQFIGMSSAWLKKSRTKRFRGVIDAPPFVRAGVKRVVYRIADLEAWQERHLEHVGPAPAGDAAPTDAISQECDQAIA